MGVIATTRRALVGLALACPAVAGAAEWTWNYAAADSANETAPQVEICPFRYGKTWAYTLEIDDCPITTLTVAQPLLAKQQFTDAPPGIPGGKPMPFVGGAAAMVVRVEGNSTFLSWDDLRKLQGSGWGVLNHSYLHKGHSWGDPPELLTAERIRHDLFWSQALIGAEAGNGRAPTHFVFPNGYTDYAQYFAEFGIISGSRVAGTGGDMPYTQNAKLLDLPRNYLDEGTWKKDGRGEVLYAFPADPGPVPGQVVIDFTHGIDAKPESENHQRWESRLERIGSAYGQQGKDNVWSAPSDEIFAYVTARQQAKVSAARGRLTVSLPDAVPGVSLTLRLAGLGAAQGLQAPPGGTLYRQGDVVWVTTPRIGLPGAKAPAIRRIYRGPAKSIAFEQPIRLAGVRLRQAGDPAAGAELQLAALTQDGGRVPLVGPGAGEGAGEGAAKLTTAWGIWRLYGLLPNRPAVTATGLEYRGDPSIRQMEIWAAAD